MRYPVLVLTMLSIASMMLIAACGAEAEEELTTEAPPMEVDVAASSTPVRSRAETVEVERPRVVVQAPERPTVVVQAPERPTVVVQAPSPPRPTITVTPPRPPSITVTPPSPGSVQVR